MRPTCVPGTGNDCGRGNVNGNGNAYGQRKEYGGSTGHAGVLCRVSHIHVCHKFYSMLHVTRLACRLYSSTALSLSGQRSPKSSQRSLHHKDADINDSTVRPGWQESGQHPQIIWQPPQYVEIFLVYLYREYYSDYLSPAFCVAHTNSQLRCLF